MKEAGRQFVKYVCRKALGDADVVSVETDIEGADSGFEDIEPLPFEDIGPVACVPTELNCGAQ